MNSVFELIAAIVEVASLVIAVIFLVSMFFRKNQQTLGNTLIMGGLFSFAVFITMADPFDFGKYGVYDIRSLLIGVATAILGPVAGLMTVTVGLIMRISIGGPGMIPGIVSILCTFGAAMIWRTFLSDRFEKLWMKSASLGVFITMHALGILAFPPEMWGKLFVAIVPAYLAMNLVGSFLMLYLISGELLFVSEAEKSRRDATTDHLTGLLNRRGFEQLYPKARSSAEKNQGRALLYFDIDHFKGFNDTHGHKTGDDVLRYVAEQIEANLRPNDIFARLGGDEFAVVLDQIDAQKAEQIAERCRRVVADGNVTKNDVPLSVSISIGAIWMLGHTEIDDILDQADKALYRAKEKGRNAVEFRHERNTYWAPPNLPKPA